MQTRKIFFVLIFFLSFLYSIPLFACRFTVREIGYSDLAASRYKLYFYLPPQTAAEDIRSIQRISRAALLDANVEAEVISPNDTSKHTALKYLSFWEITTFPAAIFAGPAGQSIVIPVQSKTQSIKEMMWTTIENVVTSPVREKILKNIANSYCVVLLIEGNEIKQNRAARTTMKKAIQEIQKIMNQLPKPVDSPPLSIVIPPNKPAEEDVLLWSLGLNPKQITEPVIVIIFGRGRRLGPLLIGDRITENALYNLLTLVGADCECGLDRSWMLGTMIPARWSIDIQTGLVKQLGFDVENPMIKAEMSRILSISAAMRGEAAGQNAENLYGYREQTLDVTPQSDIPRVNFSQIQAMNSPAERSPLARMLLIVGTGFVLVILVAGLWIWLRARRKKNNGI